MCKVIDNQELFDSFVESWAEFRNCSISEILELAMVKEYAVWLGVETYSKKY